MRISIIIPVYNVGEYLEATLQSVVTQCFGSFEVLLVNDGSSDGSGDICDSYAAQYETVRVFHQANQGVSVARNRGLEEARGEWIAFLDGDDELCEGALRRAVSERFDTSVDICLLDAREQKSDGGVSYYCPVPARADGVSYDSGELITKSGYYPRGVVWGALYRREFIERHALRFIEGVINSQDSIFARFAEHYARRVQLRRVDFCMVNYRSGSASRSWSEQRLRHYITNFTKIEAQVVSRGIDYRNSEALNRLVFANATYMLIQSTASALDCATLRELHRSLSRTLKASSLYPVHLRYAQRRIKLLSTLFNLSLRLYAWLLSLTLKEKK